MIISERFLKNKRQSSVLFCPVLSCSVLFCSDLFPKVLSGICLFSQPFLNLYTSLYADLKTKFTCIFFPSSKWNKTFPQVTLAKNTKLQVRSRIIPFRSKGQWKRELLRKAILVGRLNKTYSMPHGSKKMGTNFKLSFKDARRSLSLTWRLCFRTEPLNSARRITKRWSRRTRHSKALSTTSLTKLKRKALLCLRN